ncbi:MAG TPA: DinB family protein [Candidatus Bathyarchaeia archaeon]
MNEVKFLIDQLKTTFSGDSWHGPSVMKTLEGIDAGQAAARPLGERHTVWELVDHMTYWLEEVLKSLKDRRVPKPDKVVDWPGMGGGEGQWRQSVGRLEAAVNMLVDELATWTNGDLEKTVAGANYNYRQMLHGVIHHNLYHAGQIAILKRKV